MIRLLEKFEDSFPDIEDRTPGLIFKGDIKAILNDAIRAHRDELYDFDIEYRPFKWEKGNIKVTPEALKVINNIEFSENSIKIASNKNNERLLYSVRNEFGCGVVYLYDDSIFFEVKGIASCVECVIPILDTLIGKNKEYIKWRKKIIENYLEIG
jgi:hypothetical protein